MLRGFGGTDVLNAGDATADTVIDCGESGASDNDRTFVSAADLPAVVNCEVVRQ